MSNRFFALPRFQLFDTTTGDPLQDGEVFFYENGTTTKKVIYTDYDRTVAADNPVVLNARGEGVAVLGSGSYTVLVKDANGLTLWSEDDIEVTDDSITSYGASGNGSTDDTVAIQAAADSGKAVFVPHGTYLYTSNIAVSAALWRFWGDGTFQASATTFGFTVADTTTDIHLEGVTFNNCNGITSNSTSDFDSVRLHKVNITNSTRGLLLYGQADDVMVTDCRFDTIAQTNDLATFGVQVGDDTTANATGSLRVRIEGCHFDSIVNSYAKDTHAILVHAQDVRIHDNAIRSVYNSDNSTCEAIYVKSGRASITGNTLTDVKQATDGAITCKGTTYGAGTIPGWENVVSGNVITNTSDTQANQELTSGITAAATNMVVSNNILKNCKIYVRDADSSGLISNNLVNCVYDNATTGPRVLDMVDVTDWTVSDNRFITQAVSLETVLTEIIRVQAAATAVSNIQFIDNRIYADYSAVTTGTTSIALIALMADAANISDILFQGNVVHNYAPSLASATDANIFRIDGTDPFTITDVRVVGNDFSKNRYQVYVESVTYTVPPVWTWQRNQVAELNLTTGSDTIAREWQSRIDNTAAAADVTVLMDTALVGMVMEIHASSLTNKITLTPSGGDTFTDGATSFDVHFGMSVTLECFADSVWHVTRQGVASTSFPVLTDNSGGTADTTLVAISAGYVQAEVANNFADLAAAINEIRATLRGQ